MDHFGMTPRTIKVNSPHENGDVESLNGALKRRMKQRLLLRGSRDFADLDEYRLFLEQVIEKANTKRTERLEEDLAQMKLLSASRLAEHKEFRCPVRSGSTITVDLGSEPTDRRESRCATVSDSHGGVLSRPAPT